jgi:23S rRNA (guanosine2251-2'-O)-methyltransferase
MDAIIYGVQPVLEALRAKKRIERIYIARERGAKTDRLRAEAEKQRIKVIAVPRDELTKRAGHTNHQGVVAALAEGTEDEDASVSDILEVAKAKGEEPLVLLLDQIQDPQNLGALIRSAYALGAHGLVVPKDRAAQVTAAVVRASSGAALHMKVAQVVNLKHALTELREAGVWSAAAVMDGDPAYASRLDGPLAIVIGSEGKGVRPTLAADCDLRVSIPLPGGFDSLNAAVAGAILLYEAVRQRARTP